MKIRNMFAVLAVLFVMLAVGVHYAKAQVVESLSVDQFKSYCLGLSPRLAGDRVNREAVFDFFETGSVEAAAAKHGLAPREEARRLALGADGFKTCLRQKINLGLNFKK